MDTAEAAGAAAVVCGTLHTAVCHFIDPLLFASSIQGRIQVCVFEKSVYDTGTHFFSENCTEFGVLFFQNAHTRRRLSIRAN